MNHLTKIRLLLLDVDGVLTNGHIWISDEGHTYKAFCTQDGLGMKRLQQSGIPVGLITGCHSNVIEQRAQQLNIDYLHKGCSDKLPVFHEIRKKLNLSSEEVCYVGDDLPDLPVIQAAGLGVAVANAVDPVIKAADWVTQKAGGAGAVREVCDYLLVQQRGHDTADLVGLSKTDEPI